MKRLILFALLALPLAADDSFIDKYVSGGATKTYVGQGAANTWTFKAQADQNVTSCSILVQFKDAVTGTPTNVTPLAGSNPMNCAGGTLMVGNGTFPAIIVTPTVNGTGTVIFKAIAEGGLASLSTEGLWNVPTTTMPTPSNLAPSATIDTTVATNITSGTLPCSRLQTFTGDLVYANAITCAASVKSSRFSAPGPIGDVTPSTGKFTALTITNLLISNAAPTISSGFGTSPIVTANNGTAAFRINVGTGGTATSGVIGLPAAATGWNCFCTDITTKSSTVFMCKQTADTTTTATIGNFTTAGAAGAWVASNVLAVSCFSF